MIEIPEVPEVLQEPDHLETTDPDAEDVALVSAPVGSHATGA